MPVPVKRRKSNDLRPIFRDIFICLKKELAPFATVFIFPAENFELQKFGTLFGILKVDDYSESSSYVVNLLTSVIKKEYYSKLHRTPEESFEASLRKANLALAELARHGATGWAGKIHFAGGAIERNNLYFAGLGDVSILLARDGQLASISEELEEEKEMAPHPLKTFSNISSGKLEYGDKLIFTTRELTDIFSNEELRQNILHFSREEFPGFLEISLGANSELAGAIVIDLMDEASHKETAVVSPILGKEKIIEFEESPDESPTKPRGYSSEGMDAKRFVSQDAAFGESKRPEDASRKILGKISRFALFAFQTLAGYFKRMGALLERYFRNVRFREKLKKPDFSSVTRKSRIAFGRIRPATDKIKNRAFSLARNSFAGKIGAAGLVLILAFSLIYALFIRNRSEPAPQPPVENSEIALAPQIFDDINIKQIENIEEVITPPQNISRLEILNDILYGISGSSKTVTKIDPSSKNIEELTSSLNTGNFILLAAMPDLNTLFMLTTDNKVVSLTPINKNFQENGIALPAGLKTADIKSFLTYLYFLDPTNNQIYRYPRSEGGFGEIQSWLRSGSDIKTAKSFAINDDLFTADSNSLNAYLQGRTDEKIAFEKPSVALEIDRIYSEPGFEAIYVLNNASHRIVKFSKDGKIAAQYWSADISNIKDFAVDEKNKAIYLTKENKLLKFSL